MGKAFSEENYNPDDVKNPVKDDGNLKIGDKANPTIIKLCVDPRRPKESFRKTLYHRYLIGPDPRADGRFMVSRKILQDKDPIADAYWEAYNEAKALKESGKEDSPEWRRADQQKKLYAMHDRFHILVVQLNASKPKVLTTVGQVKDLLFGREAWGDKPATKGLVNEMKDLKRNPFNLRIETGWLKLYKTGQGIDTRYFAEEYKVEQVMKDPETGEEESVSRPFKAKVNPAIFDLDIDQCPDLSQQDLDNSKMVWTLEECETFVKSKGTSIPERCRKKSKQDRDQQEENQPDPNFKAGKEKEKAPWEESAQTDTSDEQPEEPKAKAKPTAVKSTTKATKVAAPAEAGDLDEVF